MDKFAINETGALITYKEPNTTTITTPPSPTLYTIKYSMGVGGRNLKAVFDFDSRTCVLVKKIVFAYKLVTDAIPVNLLLIGQFLNATNNYGISPPWPDRINQDI